MDGCYSSANLGINRSSQVQFKQNYKAQTINETLQADRSVFPLPFDCSTAIATIQTTLTRLPTQPTTTQRRQTILPSALFTVPFTTIRDSPCRQTAPFFLRFLLWGWRAGRVIHLVEKFLSAIVVAEGWRVKKSATHLLLLRRRVLARRGAVVALLLLGVGHFRK